MSEIQRVPSGEFRQNETSRLVIGYFGLEPPISAVAFAAALHRCPVGERRKVAALPSPSVRSSPFPGTGRFVSESHSEGSFK
jgi:hypothetical protein